MKFSLVLGSSIIYFGIQGKGLAYGVERSKGAAAKKAVALDVEAVPNEPRT